MIYTTCNDQSDCSISFSYSINTGMPIKLAYVHLEQASLVPRPLLEKSRRGLGTRLSILCLDGLQSSVTSH